MYPVLACRCIWEEEVIDKMLCMYFAGRCICHAYVYVCNLQEEVIAKFHACNLQEKIIAKLAHIIFRKRSLPSSY